METTSTRGFAGISPERRRELASKGGRAAHRKGTGRQWTAEQARAAAMIAVNNKRARKCKKAMGECQTCDTNIAWFKRLSLTDLSVALDDKTGGK